MYDETHSESKRVNKLNTVLRSCCLKQFFYGIYCLIFILYVILCPNLTKFLKQKKTFEWQDLPLLKLSQNARTAIKYCYNREKRNSNKSDIYQAAKSIYR